MATNNRNGKHKRSKVRIQLVVERDTKAVLVYTASLLGMTLTDMMINGGLRIAESHGVIDHDFRVLPDHTDGVALVKAMLETQEGDK